MYRERKGGRFEAGGKTKKDKMPAGDQVAHNHITVKVKGQDGKEVFFRMKSSQRLKKLMITYCDRQSVELNAIAFLFHGHPLRAEQKPDELGMKDGDEIVAMLHHRRWYWFLMDLDYLMLHGLCSRFFGVGIGVGHV